MTAILTTALLYLLPPAQMAAWSEPVDGLRARLGSRQARYAVGDPVVLLLEVQNGGKAELEFDEPQFLPLISSPGRHPFGWDHPYPWVITCEPTGDGPGTPRSEEQAPTKAVSRFRLKPGQVYRVEIAGLPLERSFGKDSPREEGKPQKEQVHFVGAGEPGVYHLKAVFVRAQAGKRAGAAVPGKPLETPAVRIEVVAPKGATGR